MRLSDTQIEDVLTGTPYPARMWQIVAWAAYNGAGPAVLDALYAIPERSYDCAHEIVDAVRTSGPEADRVCHHRRHPRMCSARHDFQPPLAS